jgi:hypothetical protein
MRWMRVLLGQEAPMEPNAGWNICYKQGAPTKRPISATDLVEVSCFNRPRRVFGTRPCARMQGNRWIISNAEG